MRRVPRPPRAPRGDRRRYQVPPLRDVPSSRDSRELDVTAVEAVRTDSVRARERILESATGLFWRHGFSSTSVAQVAEGARVSKSLIFWHFENKDNLFRAALEHGLDAFAVEVRGDLQVLSAIEQLNWLIDEYYAFVSTHLRSVKFLVGL